MDNRKDLPQLSYSTALDYFVGTCFAFVMVSVIQFAGVHFFTKHGSGEIPPETDSEEEEGEEEEATNHIGQTDGFGGTHTVRENIILIWGVFWCKHVPVRTFLDLFVIS